MGPKKWVTTVKNYHTPKFDFSSCHRFRPKFDFTVMAQNHGVDHLGTLWPMGSHWVQRMGQNRKKLPCPKFDFTISTKIRLYNGSKSRCRPPRVTLWTMGSHWVQKGVKTVKKYHDSNFRLPRGYRFRPKFDFTVMAPNHGGD